MPIAVAPTGNPSIDGILWGWKWDSPELSVSFPQTLNVYNGYQDIQGFTPFTQFQINQIVNFGLNNLGVFTGLTFRPDNQGFGDLRFAQASLIDYGQFHFNRGPHEPGNQGSAEANPPDPNLLTATQFGDNWFALGKYEAPELGSFQYAAGLLHEMGHSLGLKHGHHEQQWSFDNTTVFPTLPAAEDGQEFSVMSYRSYIGDPLTGASGQEEYPWTYMLNDYRALQHLYGANFGPGSNNTDNVYRFDPQTGAMTVDDFTFAQPYNAKILLTLWDGGGIDTYDFSNYANDQDIDLRPGAYSTFSTAQLSNLSLGRATDGDQFARGNVANPYLYQGDLRSLIENANTGSGHDRIDGNQLANHLRAGDGRDTISGGAGDDTIEGGATMADLRDLVFGGEGNDTIDGGYGNDELRGDAGNDQIAGGFGADTVIGGTGNDTLTGSAFGDVIFGGDGMDFVNGGFGSDRVNGGAGGDTFFHLGIGDHGSDWIQDYNAAAGDVLLYGGAGATRAQFQVNTTTTAMAGADAVQEAFVIYRPSGQILWALVDGDGQAEINLRLNGQVFDLTA